MIQKQLRTFIILIIMIIPGLSLIFAQSTAFETKCSKCHSLRDPDKYTKTEWKYNVERMAKRAGLTEEETKQIINMNKKK